MVNEKEVKDWYNKRHRSFGENAWRPYKAYPIFLDYLNVKSGKKLIDIGCGTGQLLKAANLRGLQTYGIDISDEAVEIAKKISKNSEIYVGRGEELKFQDRIFDYITCLGALEHFLDMKKGIKEMVRVGKDNALFCIMVPNINYFLWKIRGKMGTEQQDINENLLSLKEWKDLFVLEGLEILNIYHDRGIIKNINLFESKNPLSIMKKIMYMLAWIFIPLNFTYQFIFILKKNN